MLWPTAVRDIPQPDLTGRLAALFQLHLRWKKGTRSFPLARLSVGTQQQVKGGCQHIVDCAEWSGFSSNCNVCWTQQVGVTPSDD